MPTFYLFGIDAFALRQKGSELLNAEPHTKEIQTTLNGEDIDDNRKDYSKAKGVMVHIAGWYNNGKTLPFEQHILKMFVIIDKNNGYIINGNEKGITDTIRKLYLNKQERKIITKVDNQNKRDL